MRLQLSELDDGTSQPIAALKCMFGKPAVTPIAGDACLVFSRVKMCLAE